MLPPAPDPFDRVTLWSSSSFRADDWPEWPLFVFEYEELAAHCDAALDARRASYPELINRGILPEREAAGDIRGWELLAGEWRWIVGGADADGAAMPPAGTLTDRRAAVELALERIRQRFDGGDRRHDLYRQTHLNLALRWHLGRLRGNAPAVHHYAALSRQLRDEAAGRADRPTERSAA